MDILNPKKNKQANNKWHVILYLMGVSILSRLFKGILSTTIVILSYPKLLSFSVDNKEDNTHYIFHFII